MLNNEFIIADLVFRDCARGAPDEQDFYETFGKASVVRPALNHALAAVRAAFRRLGKDARHLHVGSRAHTATHSA
jgi:hypothetical protein